MDITLEIVKALVGLKDNPVALLSFVAFGSLGLAAWAIYALIVALGHRKGEKP